MGMDMNKLLEQMGQMQQQMQQAQEELANETVESSAGGGMVTVTANGAGEIKAIVPENGEAVEYGQPLVVIG